MRRSINMSQWVRGRLDLLGLRRRAVDELRGRTVEAALPGGRNLGLLGERDRELMAARAPIGGKIARSGLGSVFGLVANSAHPTAPQGSICHSGHLRNCLFIDFRLANE